MALDRDVSPGGLEGVATPPDFGLEMVGSQVLSWGCRGRVVKYYYILSCAGSMLKSGDF